MVAQLNGIRDELGWPVGESRWEMICEIGLRFGSVFRVAGWIARVIRDYPANMSILIAFEKNAVGSAFGHRPMQMDFIADSGCREIGYGLR
jgi:hypothetical protein